jgi:2-desacetyl-2-hydroxyethyl bacteriochlorophyllide A dehydrogenase
MIEAKALVCDAQQRFSLEDVLLQEPDPDQVTIRTHWSGVSVGTEFALIRNKISWGPYPLCTGYMGSGIVEAIGSAIDNFAAGDKVYFRRNDSMTASNGGKISCVSGAHCSHAVLRANTSHGVDHVPEGVGMDAAAMFVMPAVGLHGVDMANPRMGQKVVVYGVGLIGLGVVAACVHRGCEVIAIDVNAKALETAKAFGANFCLNSRECDVTAEVARIAPGGADVVFEATGIPACLDPAIALCRPFGTFVWQGNYGATPVSLHFLPPHGKQLNMVFPCDDGHVPCRRAVLRNMASGALRWDMAITHRIPCQDAPDLFARLNRGEATDVIGAAIRWSG